MSNPKVPEVFTKGWKPPFQEQQGAPGKQQGTLEPQPVDDVTADGKPYRPSGKLEGKAALITGADSGIGRAVAILFALEGADVTLAYKPEEKEDAAAVEKYIAAKTNGKAKIAHAPLDLRSEENCKKLVDLHLKAHNGKLDSLVLNHGTQEEIGTLPDIPTEQWNDVFTTNIHSFFFIVKAALPHMPNHGGGTIVFDASVNPSVGHPGLVDYTATKGAIVGFGRALSNQIVGERGIRVNIVAPGPIWTPLIPATMSKGSIEKFGVTTPIGRPGQPVEIATCFVFLASADSSYMSGQVLHPNGGVIIA
ncbi:NAD-binding protein [Fomitiporia mediterranea MF3/22]|uniref:NAD-binding protein n=1 Tax=Fomitiporia mediterranea (strain MF3/22) TaxID=694068 RepID=UPI000440848E|nr:NAD-binding protein [Fomitiporia mediterranea MF3/22]EJD05476.1 NAD-binding protein [Fomitiporia mediterranea MF3/22]